MARRNRRRNRVPAGGATHAPGAAAVARSHQRTSGKKFTASPGSKSTSSAAAAASMVSGYAGGNLG